MREETLSNRQIINNYTALYHIAASCIVSDTSTMVFFTFLI
jgi:hypothetical protein